MPTPHKCPKCDGRGQLQYDPRMPFSTGHTSCGPWPCDACGSTGILWSHGSPLPEPPYGPAISTYNASLTRGEAVALKR